MRRIALRPQFEEFDMRQSYGLWAGTAALVLSFMCDSARAQVSFNEFVEGCLITSMSADGSVAVGNYGGGSNADVFRWTAAGGVELIGVERDALESATFRAME